MTDTANAREIIENALISELFIRCQPNRGEVFSWFDEHKPHIVGAAIAGLQAAGLEIRPIAPPAGKEAVDEAARAFYRKVWERAIEPPPAWELLPEDNADKVFCREYAVHVLAAIRVPLIQQGLEKAAGIADKEAGRQIFEDQRGFCRATARAIATSIRARIDAMGKGEE